MFSSIKYPCHLSILYISVTKTIQCVKVKTAVFFNLEEGFHMISGGIILHRGVSVLPHHVVDRLHDVQHLLQKQTINTIQKMHFFTETLHTPSF